MEKITKLGLLCSLAGLAAIYAGAVYVRPSVTPIAKIDNEFLGLKVIISGQVVDLRESNGHLFLKLQDNSGGVISVPIFSSTRSQLGDSIELLDEVQVTGEVGLYRGELQVVPEEAGDVIIVHSPCMGVVSIGADLLGEPIRVIGVVEKREIVGRGNIILTLAEDGGQLAVFVPASVARSEQFPEVHVGYTVQASGWLQMYENELELRITRASNIKVIEAA
jgi:DNA/RNA endonuclease YhcR with UshA esterase domain